MTTKIRQKMIARLGPFDSEILPDNPTVEEALLSLESRVSQQTNILDYKHLVSGDPLNGGDWTAAFNAALSLGNNVYVPSLSGGYYITDMLTMGAAGQQIIGDGATKSYFKIDNVTNGKTFNISALAVVRIPASASENLAGLTNMGFVFQQPTIGLRDDMTKYPPAIYCQNVARVMFGGVVRISGAWDGVDARGNTGGMIITGKLEIGALNKGLMLDGALDFVEGKVQFWPWGFVSSSTAAGLAWRDGLTIGLDCGRVDGLNLEIECFRTRLVFFTGSGGQGAFGTIPRLNLDGNGAKIEGACQRLAFGPVYSTSDLPDDYILNVNNGAWIFSSISAFGATTGTTPYILTNNAIVTIGTLEFQSGSPNAAIAKVTNGRLAINNLQVRYGTATTRTVGFVEATGGRLTLKGLDIPSMSTGSGPALVITNDDKHDIDINCPDWGVTLPATIVNGKYTIRKTFTTVPTVSFATQGDAIISYPGTRYCEWRISNSRIFFNLHVDITTTHSTANGAIQYNTLIPYPPSVSRPITISALSNVVFSASEIITAEIAAQGQILLRRCISGNVRGSLGATTGGTGEFPSASGVNRSVVVSGWYDI